MVLIPGSEHDWVQHVHASGRVFLSNCTTKETRWLWTKWNINGRLFVRNAINPNQRRWVDEMDYQMRLQSGTATAPEIQMHISAANTTTATATANKTTQPTRPAKPTSIPVSNHHNKTILPSATALRSAPRPTDVPTYQPHARTDARNNTSLHLSTEAATHSHTLTRTNTNANANMNNSTTHASLTTTVTQPTTGRFPYQKLQQPDAHTTRAIKSDALRIAPPLNNRPAPRKQKYIEQIPNVNQPISKKRPNGTEQPANHSQFRYFQSISHHSPTHSQGPDRKRARFQNDPHAYPPPKKIPSPRPRARVQLAPQPTRCKPLNKQHRLPRTANRLRAQVSKAYGDIVVSEHRRCHQADRLQVGSVFATGLDDSVTDPVIGTSEDIEKEYLRLTSAPRPEAVRPPPVLQRALEHIRQKLSEGRDYDWACRQLKSIRQDYKVQAVQDSRVVDVYEMHARLALQNNDLGEFNTCVAQVRELYKKVPCSKEVQDEFTAYRVLYNVTTNAKASEQLKLFASLTAAERKYPVTDFALRVREAVRSGNFRRFFSLVRESPEGTMVHYLLRMLERRVRHRALCACVAAYGVGVPGVLGLRFLLEGLGWDGVDESSEVMLAERVVSDEEVLKKCRQMGLVREARWVFQAVEFLLDFNVVLVHKGGHGVSAVDALVVDCKATKARGVRALRADGKLITHAGAAFNR